MEQYDLLKHLVNTFESLGIRYLVTGSIASIFYGEPRFTNEETFMLLRNTKKYEKGSPNLFEGISTSTS